MNVLQGKCLILGVDVLSSEFSFKILRRKTMLEWISDESIQRDSIYIVHTRYSILVENYFFSFSSTSLIASIRLSGMPGMCSVMSKRPKGDQVIWNLGSPEMLIS